MPNYVCNTMYVDSSWKAKLLDANGNVDFGITIPIPDSIIDIDDSSHNIYALYYYVSERCTKSFEAILKTRGFKKAARVLNTRLVSDESIAKYFKDFPESVEDIIYWGCSDDISDSERQSLCDKFYNLGKVMLSNIKKYGCTTNYDFPVKYWGTKWNAMESSVFTYSNGTMDISFQTAWCPPDLWLKDLCKKHGVPFVFEWEEDDGLRGYYISDGKVFTSKYGRMPKKYRPKFQ